MVQKLQPLTWDIPIVDNQGRPTPEFMRKWAQQFGINGTIPDLSTAAQVSALLDKIAATAGMVLVRGTLIWQGLASPADAKKFLNGATPHAFAQVKDSDLATTDVTDNDVSITKHGFAPKAPNDATLYLNGTGVYSVPAGSGGGGDGEPDPTNPGWDLSSAQGLNGSTFYSVPLTSLNTVATTPASAVQSVLWCAPGRVTGKRYFEMVLVDSFNGGAIGLIWGIGRSNFRNGVLGQDIGQLGWPSGGAIQSRWDFSVFGSSYTVASIQGWASGNTLCCAVDLDARLIWFRTNGGNWNNSGTADPATGTGGIDLNRAYQRISAPIKLYPAANANNNSGDTATVNLGTSAFAQAMPSGFVAWKT